MNLVRDPPAKAQPRRQEPPWVGGQLSEFLGRQAAVPRLSTHERQLEGARIALSETKAQEASDILWTDDHHIPWGLVRGSHHRAAPSKGLRTLRAGVTGSRRTWP